MYESRYCPACEAFNSSGRTALVVGRDVPGLRGRFDRFSFGRVGHAVQRGDAFALYGLVIERLRLESRCDRVADLVVAAVCPGEDLKRLAGDQNFTRSRDGAARLIDDLGPDGVAMIGIAVQGLRQGRVDGELHRAVRTDRRRRIEHDFGDSVARAEESRRPRASPMTPAGKPRVIGPEPPVSRAEKPVPGRGGVPSGGHGGADHAVMNAGLSHGAAKVIVRADGGRELVAQADRLLGSVHFHFELGLFVLLDTKRRSAKEVFLVDQMEAVFPQTGIGRKGEFAVETAVRIGFERLFKRGFVPRIRKADLEFLAGKRKTEGASRNAHWQPRI